MKTVFIYIFFFSIKNCWNFFYTVKIENKANKIILFFYKNDLVIIKKNFGHFGTKNSQRYDECLYFKCYEYCGRSDSIYRAKHNIIIWIFLKSVKNIAVKFSISNRQRYCRHNRAIISKNNRWKSVPRSGNFQPICRRRVWKIYNQSSKYKWLCIFRSWKN